MKGCTQSIIEMESEFHIGEHIKSKLKEYERSEAWLARKVYCDPGNFCRMLKKGSIDMDLLRRISVVMKYNFCKDYSDFVQSYIDEVRED